MSCRVDRLEMMNVVVLRVSGRITGQDVDLLRELVDRERGSVAIDLKGVLLVDREVVKLLAASEAKGLELRNSPAYIREWVTRESERGKLKPSDKATEASEENEDV